MAKRADSAPAPQGPVVSIADFGAGPDGSDAGPAFEAALERLPRSGGVLHVPPGTWRLGRTEGACLRVSGFENLAIEGVGACLVLDEWVKLFEFHDCRAPAVRGFTVDFARPPFSQGEVTRVSPDRLYAEVQVDARFPVNGSETVSAIGTYDRGSGLTAMGGIDAYEIVERATLVSHQRLGLALSRMLPLKAGDTVVLRHALYAASALSFHRCKGILVEDVTLRTAPGMGVYADRCAGGTVRRLRIAAPPDTENLMTTTADGVHFNSCSGPIGIEDCAMSRMGDDCVNIHSKYFRIERLLDARTVVVKASSAQLTGPGHPGPAGDRVEFVDAQSLATRGEAVIDAAEASDEGLTTLRLGSGTDESPRAGDLLFDTETRSQASILRCVFGGNRARGVLAHSNVLIQGCSFSGQSAEAVLMLPNDRFMEGPAAEMVTIRDNEISRVLRAGGRSGAIRVGILAGPQGRKPGSAPVNRKINITDNRFLDAGGPAVFAECASDVFIAGNRIGGSRGPAVILRDVARVAITGNVCSPSADVLAPAGDRAEISMKGNTGLALSEN